MSCNDDLHVMASTLGLGRSVQSSMEY